MERYEELLPGTERRTRAPHRPEGADIGQVGPAPVPPGAPPSPARLAALQRLAGNAGVSSLVGDAVQEVVSSPGRPLDTDVRADMEQRLGHDFSDVRVHTDGDAHRSAESVSARAFTSGSHIVFQRDAYDPSSEAGRHTLAHELTHVVQQRSGPVEGTPTGDGLSVSSPDDRHEREAVASADRAMAAPPAPAAAPAAVAAVQREEDAHADHEGHEGPAVQREELPPEEEKEEATTG